MVLLLVALGLLMVMMFVVGSYQNALAVSRRRRVYQAQENPVQNLSGLRVALVLVRIVQEGESRDTRYDGYFGARVEVRGGIYVGLSEHILQEVIQKGELSRDVDLCVIMKYRFEEMKGYHSPEFDGWIKENFSKAVDKKTGQWSADSLQKMENAHVETLYRNFRVFKKQNPFREWVRCHVCYVTNQHSFTIPQPVSGSLSDSFWQGVIDEVLSRVKLRERNEQIEVKCDHDRWVPLRARVDQSS